MKLKFCAFFMIAGLAACDAVLRQPAFEPGTVEVVEAEVTYNITAYDVGPEVVQRANQSAFVRFVNVGGEGQGAVRRVDEAALFSGEKPSANQRFRTLIKRGDKISFTTFGYENNKGGVLSRSSSTQEFLVDDRGAIELPNGVTLSVAGRTVEGIRVQFNAALRRNRVVQSHNGIEAVFPKVSPPEYTLGVGDVFRIATLPQVALPSGDKRVVTVDSLNVVGADGTVSILRLGEIEVAGLTLSQARSMVVQEARRNAIGEDITLEIEKFRSKSVVISGELGTHVVPVTNRPTTYGEVLAELSVPVQRDQDYRVTLLRDGRTYRMKASQLLNEKAAYFLLDGDRVTISAIVPAEQSNLTLVPLAERHVSYLRVLEADAPSQRGALVNLEGAQMDLRQVLIGQGVDVNYDRDLLVRLSRNGRTYNLSAKSVVLTEPNRRYWMKPDDHVVVEDIAYVGDKVLLLGEVRAPQEFLLERRRRTSLSTALFEGGAFGGTDADFKHIYVLRGQNTDYDAYHFDLTKVLNLKLADAFELRPGDVVFIGTRPLTKYSRALNLAFSAANTSAASVASARALGDS